MRYLGVKELLVQEVVQARKVVIRMVGTDDNLAEVGTKYIEDVKKLTRLLGLGGVRMKRSLKLGTSSVAPVV